MDTAVFWETVAFTVATAVAAWRAITNEWAARTAQMYTVLTAAAAGLLIWAAAKLV
jgi:hypothetical protein